MGGLTLTVITSRASSLNYGETMGNVSVLKKVTLGDGTQRTFVSDKALKYDIRRKGKEEKGWRLLDERLKEYVKGNLSGSTLNVDEFGKALVKDYEEFDLLGGLFTNLRTDKKVKLSHGESVKRTCPVKVTYAFSISGFKGDMNFLNNISAYNRYIKHVEEKPEQAIAQTEEHTSHYIYTLTVDLDRVGVWEKEDGSTEEVLESKERAKRVKDLLDIVMTLNRQIKGRWESLAPVFIVGGVFDTKHPFFIDSVEAVEVGEKLLLNTGCLRETVDMVPEGERENLVVALKTGIFANEEEIRQEFDVKSVGRAFEELKREVDAYYGSSQV